jgi:predicted ATP-grasp superfamily ATP-dependent carboligase
MNACTQLESTESRGGTAERLCALDPKATAQVTVLLGFAEALSAPEVAWSLVDHGYRVLAFARKGRRAALRHSRHVTCYEICAPESDVERSLAELQELVVSLAADSGKRQLVLLPVDDKAVYLCGRVQPDNRWISAAPEGVRAELALNKSLQVEAARKAGFDVPNTREVRTAQEIFDFSATQSFPMFLKSAACVSVSSGRICASRNWICLNHSDLERAVSQWNERSPLLAQALIHGNGEGIFGIGTPEGVKAWSAHRRIRMMNPRGSGSSACISQPVPEDLKPKVEALIDAVQWRGLFMIEVLRDSSGTYWFVELNGRAWGSMALARRVGLEYPAWHVKLALSQSWMEEIPSGPVSGVVCRNVGRELMHMLFLLRDIRQHTACSKKAAMRTLAEVLRIRRGDTFYNWRRDDPKVFLADCFCTIHDNLFKSRN